MTASREPPFIISQEQALDGTQSPEQTLGEKYRSFAHNMNRQPQKKDQSKDPKNIRGYEPLIRHRSRTESTLREHSSVKTIDQLEADKLDFYITYFLKKPQRMTAIGLKAPRQQKSGKTDRRHIKEPREIVRDYISAGFVELGDLFRNDHRNMIHAKQTLVKATTAWQQHLRRSGHTEEKQIAIFIPKELYKKIKNAHDARQQPLSTGAPISQNQVIVDLLWRALN